MSSSTIISSTVFMKSDRHLQVHLIVINVQDMRLRRCEALVILRQILCLGSFMVASVPSCRQWHS